MAIIGKALLSASAGAVVELTGALAITRGQDLAGELRIHEDSDNGIHYVGLKSPAALAGDTTYVLPTAFPSSNDYVLTSQTNGTLAWAEQGSASTSGSININAFNTALFTNAASIATSGTIEAKGTISSSAGMIIGGDAIFSAGITVMSGALEIVGDISSSAGNLIIGGSSLISNALTVSGAISSSAGALIMGGGATLSKTLNVSGATSLAGNLSSSAGGHFVGTVFTGPLNCSGAAHFNGGIDTANDFRIEGEFFPYCFFLDSSVNGVEIGFAGPDAPTFYTSLSVYNDFWSIQGATGEGQPFTGSLAAHARGGGQILQIDRFGSLTNTTAGQLYYLNSNRGWTLAQANNNSTGAKELLAIALGTGAGKPKDVGMLLEGFIRIDAEEIDGTAVIGAPVYMCDDTAGEFDFTAPDGSNEVVRIIGHCVDKNGDGDILLWFKPEADYIEIV